MGEVGEMVGGKGCKVGGGGRRREWWGVKEWGVRRGGSWSRGDEMVNGV